MGAWQKILSRCPERGKIAFATIEDARRAANKTTWKNRQVGTHEKVKPYICKLCGMYHVGRGPKGNDQDTSV